MKNATSPSHLRFRWEGPLAGFMAVALAVLIGTGIASAQTTSAAGHSTAAMQAVASARPRAAAAPAHDGEEEESEAKPNKARQQGVKVHGHWRIDIKNTDGSLAGTHEFENSLFDGGELFSYLLSGWATSGEAVIKLNTLTTPYSGVTYLISEISTGYWATSVCASNTSLGCAYNLTVTPVAQQSSYVVVLSGSVVATTSASINSVQTGFASCSSANGLAAVTPVQCSTGTAPAGISVNGLPSTANTVVGSIKGVLTNASIQGSTSLGIPVDSGQTIQVTVTLSFS